MDGQNSTIYVGLRLSPRKQPQSREGPKTIGSLREGQTMVNYQLVPPPFHLVQTPGTIFPVVKKFLLIPTMENTKYSSANVKRRPTMQHNSLART